MPQSDPSKTEQATPKQRDKAREKGSVPKSQEVGKAVVILAGLFGLWGYISYIRDDLLALFSYFFQESFIFTPTKENIYGLFYMVVEQLAIMILPVLFLLGFVAFMASRLQVGHLWSTKVMSPKFGKVLNPLPGLKKMMLDLKTLVRLGRSLLQAAVIGVAPYLVLKHELPNLLPLYYSNASGLAAYMLETAARMVIYALVPMLVIAALDVWYSRWDYEENLKMTKDEVKDERKQMEGDPKVKAQQKQKMMQYSMQRMLNDVPKADVVITNPTHFAVALRYDPIVAPAPVVLAKGVDHFAQKIKQVARENNVPVRENRPLAQALYKSVEVGETIPEEMYQAVASILAQLNKFNTHRAG